MSCYIIEDLGHFSFSKNLTSLGMQFNSLFQAGRNHGNIWWNGQEAYHRINFLVYFQGNLHAVLLLVIINPSISYFNAG